MNTGNAQARRARCVLAGTFLLVAVLGAVLAFARTESPNISSEWPRPYDPAKPFNMLGVPGVSVEQRKRAEDLLVRSLEEAPRWSDYQAAVDAGWYSIETPRPGGFEHLINPRMADDGHMFNPLYPESLVYKIINGERIFVAYMYVAELDIALDDPRIADFAERLIEWHVHKAICILLDEGEGNLVGKIAGFAQEDGTCEVEGATPRKLDPRTLTGEVPGGPTNAEPAMTHVWVVARACGPFSTLAGESQGDTLTPLDERVDLCKH